MTRRSLLPEDVGRALARTLAVPSTALGDTTLLSGGCIHPAARLRVEGTRSVFVKWADHPGPGGFGVEARGLDTLRAAGGPRIPSVIGYGEGSPDDRGWLALEFVEPGRPSERTWVELGRGLARLHRPRSDARPGWTEDGFIGPLPQPNRYDGTAWGRFWTDVRLAPLWSELSDRFSASTRERWERMLPLLPSALESAATSGPSLLHGDLWSGNVIVDAEGHPTLIDPAVYLGDREVDLAMMELFGGFGPTVLDTYRGEIGIGPEYEDLRRDIYQLYPLLVHVRLFGTGYVAGVESRIGRILAAVGAR